MNSLELIRIEPLNPTERSEVDELAYLNNLFDLILKHFEDILCSSRYFKVFRYVQKSSYIPFIDNNNSLVSIDDHLGKSCDFMLQIYSVAYETRNFLNDFDTTSTLSAENRTLFKYVRDNIVSIKRFFFFVNY